MSQRQLTGLVFIGPISSRVMGQGSSRSAGHPSTTDSTGTATSNSEQVDSVNTNPGQASINRVDPAQSALQPARLPREGGDKGVREANPATASWNSRFPGLSINSEGQRDRGSHCFV
jgi:hypothetical protein